MVAPHRWEWRLGYLGSNTVLDQHNVTETERVTLDAELQRFELMLRYGLAERWEIAAAFPYLVMGSGYLDGFIDEFEDLFGLHSPGARESRGSNEFRYLVRVDGNNLVDRQDETLHGLGDIPLQLKYQFRQEPGGFLPRASVRGILKLPTATDSLLGNDRVGGGVGLLAEQPLGERVLLTSNLEMTSADLPRPLRSLETDPAAISGSISCELSLTLRASIQAQFTAATNPYPGFHEDLTVLNRAPMALALGWAYRFSRSTVQLSLSENINSGWSDFSWGLSFRSEI